MPETNKKPVFIYDYWFGGTSFLEVLKFFIRGIRKGDMAARSEALAFSFFLALFPSIIFLFTLIPYVPIDNFQSQLLLLIRSLLPETTFKAVETTLIDIINIKHSGILSLGFVFALYFSTNGINAMLQSFNKSYHGSSSSRPAWKQRVISLLLTIIIASLIIAAIAIMVIKQFAIKFIEQHKFEKDPKKIYELLKLGITTKPFFVIKAIDDEYVDSYSIIGHDDGQESLERFIRDYL